MNPGDLVWWWHLPTLRLWGVLREQSETQVGVEEPSGEMLYLDHEQIQPAAELPDGVYPDMPYHSNPARLSPSAAKKLLQPGGPAKFQWERTHGQKPKKEFDFGKLVHLLVLGEGDKIAPIHAPNYTTKAAREQRDKAREAGLVPVLLHEMDAANEMARVVREHPLAGKLLAEGDAETWLYATEPNTGQGVRLRTDWMTHQDDRLHLIEYKTAADANPDVFARKAYDFGYHIAFAFAVTAARLLELDGSPAYLYIVQEKEPPYLVSVNELDAEAFKVGHDDMHRAIATYRRCKASDNWPGYDTGINSISLPPWAFTASQPTLNDLLEGAD